MIKLQRCVTAATTLVILAGFSISAAAQTSSQGIFIAVSGKPARGAAVTVTVNVLPGNCSVPKQIGFVFIYNNNAAIASYEVPSGGGTFVTDYQIPNNISGASFSATYKPPAGSGCTQMLSQTLTYRFFSLAGVYSLLLNN